MDRPILGFHLDAHADWVAELACGHFQHVRHDPPWIEPAMDADTRGPRRRALGRTLACRKCDQGASGRQYLSPPRGARATS